MCVSHEVLETVLCSKVVETVDAKSETVVLIRSGGILSFWYLPGEVLSFLLPMIQ